MNPEAAAHADFSRIRYAQVWEDADVLLEALAIRPSAVCLSIASAGDNALAMLAQDPARVVAIDLNPAQLACLELRVSAIRELSREEFLVFLGSEPESAEERRSLYGRCRGDLSPGVQAFWDAHPAEIARGIGHAGKFEHYFEIFRTRVLPCVHSQGRIAALLESRSLEERRAFYDSTWDSWRWRWLFKLFFSRFTMGRLGRDPSFFRYVEGSVADRILQRTRHALTELDPHANPYLQWILLGRHATAWPLYLRPGNYERIRANLGRLEWHCGSLEQFAGSIGAREVTAFNLSDIFEYMSAENYERLLRALLDVAAPGARFAYWNMLAPRSRPDSLAAQLQPLKEIAARLHLADKAFFYSRFVVEEAVG